MRIQIRSEGRGFTILLPTGLVLSKLAARMITRTVYKHAADAMKSVEPEKFEMLLQEIGRIRKQYGPWELIEAEDSDGSYVKIVL